MLTDNPATASENTHESGVLTPLPYGLVNSGVLENAALVLADDDPARIERGLEDAKRVSGFRVTAHEHVERRIALLGPGVDADVALRQHRHAGDTAAIGEGVQMDMQQRRASRFHGVDQRL